MPARRILLIAGIAAIMAAALSPAQATVFVPETYGVTAQAQDQHGNQLEVRAYFVRIPDPISQIDRYTVSCEVQSIPGPAVFPNVSAAAAIGINPSVAGTPLTSDGCYLMLNDEAVFSAPGTGISGEVAATSSLANLGDKYYLHDNTNGGAFKACYNVRGLFTNGGLVTDARCGSQPLGV